MSRSRGSEIRQGVTPRRILHAATAALLSVTLLAGCGLFGRRHHDLAADGPLWAGAMAPGDPVDNPFPGVTSGTTWYSFGAHVLCANRVKTIKLERITYEADVKPVKLEFWLRSVNINIEIDNGNAPPRPDTTFHWTRGTPPTYVGSKIRYVGSHTRHISGRKITQRCAVTPKTVVFTDLVAAVKIDKRGADITNITIDYDADGKEYALDMDRWIIICGTEVTPRESERYEGCDSKNR